MTRKEAILKHRKMWSWLADNPGEEKEDYLKEFDPGAELNSDCYLCEYTSKYYDGRCKGCPVEWPGGNCWRHGGLFDIWCDSMDQKDYAKAAGIARQIAELTERMVK